MLERWYRFFWIMLNTPVGVGKPDRARRDGPLLVEAAGAVDRYALLGDRDDDEVRGLQLRGLVLFLCLGGVCRPQAGALGLVGPIGPVGLGVRAVDACGQGQHKTGTEQTKRTPEHPGRTGISRTHLATPATDNLLSRLLPKVIGDRRRSGVTHSPHLVCHATWLLALVGHGPRNLDIAWTPCALPRFELKNWFTASP